MVAILAARLPALLVDPKDEDGVLKLHPSAPGGTSWRLGSSNPNTASPYFQIYESTATQMTSGGITFWRSPGQSDGSATGRTHRLYIRAGGGNQNYTWLSNPGYLGSPADILNLEATAYIRPTTKISGSVNTSLQWEVRGGKHGSIPAQASTFGMQVPYTGQTAKCFREYNHPNYDYIFPGRDFAYNYPGNTWLGMKCVSYNVTGGAVHKLYLDVNPWTASGTPANNWQLYMTYNDTNVDTGFYTVPATWAGWQNFIRMDGFSYLDFAIYSAREIIPPGSL